MKKTNIQKENINVRLNNSFIITLITLTYITNILDWYSTYLSLEQWATEMNMFYYSFLQWNILYFLIFKILILSFIIYIVYKMYINYYNLRYLLYIFLLLLNIWFIFLIGHNINVINSMLIR